MAVDDPLRVARRAAGVTHARCEIFVVDAELDRLGLGEQILVVVDLNTGKLWNLARRIVHEDEMLDAPERREQRQQQSEQRLVGEDHFVVRMVHDVRQLLGEQTNVERVKNATRAGGGKVQLEVALRVPGKRGDAAVGRDPEIVEHSPEATGSLGPLAVRDAGTSARVRRHHRLVTVVLLGPVEEVDDRQRCVLHESAHGRHSSQSPTTRFLLHHVSRVWVG